MTVGRRAALGEPLGRFARMALIRGFLERCKTLHDRGEIRGSIHLGIGQEAVAVGVCSTLGDEDVITATYRGHHHALAMGTPAAAILAEMCGRATGCCGGLGGSLHLADASVGNLGSNAIVGAGVPIAVGAALARHLTGSNGVAVAFFGDGAVNQGAVMEAFNLAAVWHLPVLFACENNQFSEMTPARDMIRTDTIAERARGLGIDSERTDGMDVEAVRQVATAAIERLRAGAGPAFIEFETYRFSGHYYGDPETMRTAEDIEGWRSRDPIELARHRLLGEGATEEQLGRVERDVVGELNEAETTALRAPRPDWETAAALVPVAVTGGTRSTGGDAWHA